MRRFLRPEYLLALIAAGLLLWGIVEYLNSGGEKVTVVAKKVEDGTATFEVWNPYDEPMVVKGMSAC